MLSRKRKSCNKNNQSDLHDRVVESELKETSGQSVEDMPICNNASILKQYKSHGLAKTAATQTPAIVSTR
eukprot:1518168-Ditylum_brightwellii.AAC.1